MGAGKAAASSKPAALQKNLSRRVSFNEATLRPPPSEQDSDTESGARTRRTGSACGSVCKSCCACVSILIGVLVFLVLLVGGIYFAILQSNLPDVRLHRLDINKLNFTIESNGDTLLTADFEVRLNTTNGNGKIELAYSAMTASLSSEGIHLGEVRLPAMQQRPHVSTDVKVRTAVSAVKVEEAAAKDLVDNANRHLMVIDASVKGHMDFYVKGKKLLTGLPFKVKCHSIDQSEIDNGHAPKCNAKMSPIN